MNPTPRPAAVVPTRTLKLAAPHAGAERTTVLIRISVPTSPSSLRGARVIV